MKKLSTRDLTLAALFVAVTAVLSQIVIPMPLVPFNLGVLAIFLCGGMLRKGIAFLSIFCYLLLGAVGVPVFAQFSGGPAVLFGMTGGYLMAYPVMAWLVSFLIQVWVGAAQMAASQIPGSSAARRTRAMAAALLPCYLFGTAWFAVYLHRSFAQAAKAACIPFIPFDLAKALLGAYVTLAIQKRLGGKVTA